MMPEVKTGRESIAESSSDAAVVQEPPKLLDTGGARIIGGENNDGPGPNLLTAASMRGDRIMNTHREQLGTLAEIMLDVRAGRIAYAVMSVGGLLGIGDKLFAVPWTAFTLDADSQQLILDVSKESLREAPGFDKDHWPTMADYQWAEQVHFHYRARPYWKR
jgi:sporulation protein YlmC with PRC-barrel domain